MDSFIEKGSLDDSKAYQKVLQQAADNEKNRAKQILLKSVADDAKGYVMLKEYENSHE